MSLNKAIEFQHLISQLTEQERLGFLSKLIGSHSDVLLTSLFHHLSKPNQTNEVNEFNASLSDIIQSRKEKPLAICARSIKLDQFPKAIIGYMASFLKQRTYNRFSLCNRSIYLGCNSPNTLQQLDLHRLEHYSSINLASFPSIKGLDIDTSKAIESQSNLSFDSPNFNQVTDLLLAANNTCGWVQPFLNQNIVNYDHVTALKCSQFGSSDQKMDRNEFLSLLTRFPNLTRLRLRNVQIADDVSAKDIADACSKVVELMLHGIPNGMTTDLVRIFARNLTHLRFDQKKKNNIDFDNVAFGKLSELCLYFPHYGLFESILKSAVHLKKILIPFWSDWMSDEEIKNGITNVMVQCTFLNGIYLVLDPAHFCAVLEGIERGLFKTKKQQREEMKIIIHVRRSNFKPSDFTFNVGRIINALETCAINDYIFIWKFELQDILNKDERKAIKKELNDASMYSEVIPYRYTAQAKDFKQFRFIITNKHCKLNRHTCSICGYSI
eukprot:604822_1